jgi:hypothetical protein
MILGKFQNGRNISQDAILPHSTSSHPEKSSNLPAIMTIVLLDVCGIRHILGWLNPLEVQKLSLEDHIPKLAAASMESATLSNHLQEISATATHAELLLETERVLGAAVRAEEASMAIRTALGGGRVADLQQAVASLRELVALDEDEE